MHPFKGGSAFCGQNAFRGRGGVEKGPKTAVILNVWPLVSMDAKNVSALRSSARLRDYVLSKTEAMID